MLASLYCVSTRSLKSRNCNADKYAMFRFVGTALHCGVSILKMWPHKCRLLYCAGPFMTRMADSRATV